MEPEIVTPKGCQVLLTRNWEKCCGGTFLRAQGEEMRLEGHKVCESWQDGRPHAPGCGWELREALPLE